MEGQDHVHEVARQTLTRVAERWDIVKDDLFSGQCGYSVLGSPPKYRPELVIIGENPGFGADDIGHGAHVQTSWPTASYADGESWALKDKLRTMFADAGLPHILHNAVVTNFLFFKSGSHSRDTALRWMDVPRDVRRPLEAFCLDELRGLLAVMEPQQAMILGMGPFSKRVADQALGVLADDGKRWLIGTGTLWGVPAFGVMHPTGARWTTEERGRAVTWLRSHFAKE